MSPTAFVVFIFAALTTSSRANPNSTFVYYNNEDGVPWSLPKKLFEFSPPFTPVETVSEACRNDSLKFLSELYRFQLPALKMYDASAKLPSGILNGNVNQYGDYDLCRDAGGRYCLAYLDMRVADPGTPLLRHLHALAYSHGAFRSSLRDPGHRVPRFSTIHWAMCVPSSCSPSDVQASFSATVDQATAGTGLVPSVNVFPEMCPDPTPQPIPLGTILTGTAFVILLLTIALATFVDIVREGAKASNFSQELLLAFSLRANGIKLFSLKVPEDDISSIHGVRCFNAIMLYISHKSLSVFYNPFINRTTMSETLGKSWTFITRAASLYTDPFIMLSGLLTSYSLGKKIMKNQPVQIPKEITSRVMRLLPTLGALIAFCTFILPYMGSGPQWPLVIEKHAEICKSFWWRNMLLIHNYYGFRNMCLTHTHHVGIDTQLFLSSLVLVTLLYKWPRKGFITLGVIAVISTILRFYTTYVRQLNLYIAFGSSVSQMFNTADYTYILPTHRATVYVMGLVLGYLLRHCGRDIKLKKSHLTLGWFLAVYMLYQSIGPSAKMGDISYVYDPMDAANYAAFAPITWCLFFAWLIFTSHTGNSGVVSDILSWKLFQITTRISYTFYLTQFPVFFYNVGRVRTSNFFNILIMLDIVEIVEVVAASVVLTLFVEMPFQNIRTILLKRPSKPKVKEINGNTLTSNGNDIKACATEATITPAVNSKLLEKLD